MKFDTKTEYTENRKQRQNHLVNSKGLAEAPVYRHNFSKETFRNGCQNLDLAQAQEIKGRFIAGAGAGDLLFFSKTRSKQNENKMDDEELEELYLTWKSEVLKELRPFLVDNLEPQKLFAYLRSCQVLDSDDQEDIEAERTRRRKNERLLDHIKNRGADGFDNLCEAIRRNTTQLFILRKILNLFQKKKDNCSGSLTETQKTFRY